MRFPYREPDILRLANDIATGLAANPEVFPAPPYSPEDFENTLDAHDGNREAQIMSRAAAMQATAAKDESLAAIADMSKSVLRYAENHTRANDSKLKRSFARGRTGSTSTGRSRWREATGQGTTQNSGASSGGTAPTAACNAERAVLSASQAFQYSSSASSSWLRSKSAVGRSILPAT